MKKIKVTKQQAIMLENLSSKKKVIKITKEQYERLKLHESSEISKQFIKNLPDNKSRNEFRRNVNSETKIKGVMEFDESLWEEFINELYGLNETGGSKYEKLIKLMEINGYIENRKIKKSKFNDDKQLTKEVIMSGVQKLKESNNVYRAIEEMDKTYDDIVRGFRDQLSTSSTKREYTQDELKAKIDYMRKQSDKISAAREKAKLDRLKEYGNTPIGSDENQDAPWNDKEREYREGVSVSGELEVIYHNNELAILTDKSGEKYLFYFANLNKNVFEPYANIEKNYIGRDEDDLPDYEYSNDWDIDSETINSYINDNITTLSKGVGLSDFEEGVDIVKIDRELGEDLLGLVKFFSKKNPKDGEMLKSILLPITQSNSVDEVTTATSSGSFVGKMNQNSEPQSNISDELDTIVDEATTTVSTGNSQYATPGFASSDFFGNKGKKGKAPVNKGVTHKKTTIPGGKFVEFDECTKLNNNKEAQKGGCSVGAVDNVVKYK